MTIERDFPSLIREMQSACVIVESIPPGTEISTEEEDLLESTRHEALALVHEIEALFQERENERKK